MGIRDSIKRFEKMIEDHPNKTQLLVEGDSWFDIPTSKHIVQQINHKGNYNILNLASSGDEAMEMMTWEQKKKIHQLLLDEDNDYNFKALLFSGGGNDIVGPEIWHMFVDYQPGMSALDCFNLPMLDVKINQITYAYKELIIIRDNLKPDLPIITHTYDKAIPSGKGAYIGPIRVAGPWIKPSLDLRNIPKEIHQKIVIHLLGKLKDSLLALENNSNNFHVVNSFGTINGNQWKDELHPKSDGFEDIVDQHWMPKLFELGIV